MADLEEIERKQASAAKLAMEMVDEKDPERLKEMAASILERTQALEKMARGLEAALTPQGNTGQEVRVELTKDQRERIAEQTGVGVEVVVIHDSDQKKWSKDMPKTEPREIEKLAAKQAAHSRLISETR